MAEITEWGYDPAAFLIPGSDPALGHAALTAPLIASGRDWDDWVLSDVHPSGRTIVTTPHGTGPLAVRSFPGMEVLLSVDSPSADDHFGWYFTACFVGDGLTV